MILKLHNTLACEKQNFVPLDPGAVRLYVCGPTVYDFAHVGNARPVVVFDVLFRLLREVYGKDAVVYVRNITDVDDKIIERARNNQESINSLTERTAQAFFDDMAALKTLPPTHQPRATQHIGEMVAMIEKLIEKGHAYAAEGHVLFSITSMQDYGELSGRSRDDMIAGARAEVAPCKKDPADFVLWKPSRDDQPRWESPWGYGRPGWHIECSAMARSYLGSHFDIHGGGLDLIFPHHENEIAQSRCCNDSSYANYWVHNGYVVVNGQKMSKSLGNFFTVRDLLKEGIKGEALRLMLLSGHYRQPLDVNRDKAYEMKSQLDRLYGALLPVASLDSEQGDEKLPQPLSDALCDDLNTPLALSVLHDFASQLNKAESDEEKRRLKGSLLRGGQLLGILQDDPVAWFQGDDDEASEIESFIARRQEAKKARNFALADAIRNDLAAKGVVLLDGPEGTSWRRK